MGTRGRHLEVEGHLCEGEAGPVWSMAVDDGAVVAGGAGLAARLAAEPVGHYPAPAPSPKSAIIACLLLERTMILSWVVSKPRIRN